MAGTHFNDIPFHPERRMPPGYGTRFFYQQLESHAPPREAIRLERGASMSGIYPFGYYLTVAAWLEAIRRGHDGPVGLLFGARLFSVLLFTITLVLSYASCRELQLRRWLALALTAVVGFFPMATFVSSYVQPDNLAFTLVSLCFFLSLRWNRRPGSGWRSALLGLALGLLLVTKLHFFLCVFLSILPLVAARLWADRAGFLGGLRHGALLLVPVLCLWLVHLWVMWGVRSYYDERPPYKGFNITVLSGFTDALLSYYRDQSHTTFWGVFGWVDTPLVIRDQEVTYRVNWVIYACGWSLIALTLFCLERVSAKLWRLWRRGRGQTALRLAFGNVPINSYFLFTILMFAFRILTEDSFHGQGRNWLPFLLPFFLTSVVYAPKALTLRGTRRVFAGAILSGLLLFNAFGEYYAIKTLKNRYYLPGQAPRLLQLLQASPAPSMPPASSLPEPDNRAVLPRAANPIDPAEGARL
jgi:4-amino-4-deoxy-L-arabinose transferase-like glycosyltransferase